jgi:hypothetical protein
MGDLKLDPLTADNGPILTPIKLERFAGLKHQRHKCSLSSRLLRACRSAFQARTNAATRSYDPSKPSFTRSARISLAVRRSLRDLHCSITSQPDSFSTNGSSLLPSYTCKHVLPGNGPRRRLETRLHYLCPQVLPDGVARQSRPPCSLTYGHLVS